MTGHPLHVACPDAPFLGTGPFLLAPIVVERRPHLKRVERAS